MDGMGSLPNLDFHKKFHWLKAIITNPLAIFHKNANVILFMGYNGKKKQGLFNLVCRNDTLFTL